MARTGSGQLEHWEVALVKRMWMTGKFTKQEILAYFTRPDRSINQARISEITEGKRHTTIEPSSEQIRDNFLQRHLAAQRVIGEEFTNEPPLSEGRILQVLPFTNANPPALALDESDTVEWKLSFSWSSRSEYARTVAGLANNRGGYLVFGIDPSTNHLVGFEPDTLNERDPADISRFFDSCLQPAPRWEKVKTDLRGFRIGVIYVYECESRSKPLICLKQLSDKVRQGDIFYRYTGRTDRISYPEMQRLLADRDSAIQRDWMNLVERIGSRELKMLLS